jgi:hypothetical protein
MFEVTHNGRYERGRSFGGEKRISNLPADMNNKIPEKDRQYSYGS